MDKETSYCGPHHCLCYRGFGKDVAALEAMIYGTENTVVRKRVPEVGVPPDVDTVVR